VAAPKQWYLGKLKGVYSVRPSSGPHKLRECIPMSVLLHQRLHLAVNTNETRKIANDKEGNIKVDGKIRRNHRFPLGNMDVVSIEKMNTHYRILYDIKGRFQPHKISADEAKFKLCKIVAKKTGKFSVPYIVTHDGRTIRFPDPNIQIGDTIKLNLNTHKVEGVIKFANGSTVMITAGNNIGRIGVMQSVERHIGSFDIGYVKDSKGHEFSTRMQNIFVIGDGKSPAISVPKGDGVQLSIIEQRDIRLAKETVEGEEDE